MGVIMLDEQIKSIKQMLTEREHPHDIIEVLQELDFDDQVEVLKGLDTESTALLLHEFVPAEAAALMNEIEPHQTALIFAEMNKDDAVDIVAELEDEDVEQILQEMPVEDKVEIKKLTLYDEEEAGGLMTLEFVALPQTMTVKDAIGTLRNAIFDHCRPVTRAWRTRRQN